MKKSVLSFLILALSLVFVGCSGDDSGSGEAKETKGSIDVYTHNDSEEMQDFVKGLKEETGIEANVLRLSSGEGWSRMKSEAPDFGADMQWGMLHSIARSEERRVGKECESGWCAAAEM